VETLASAQGSATVRLGRGEVLALRNLLEQAHHLPLEAIGPRPMFRDLLSAFEGLAGHLDDTGYETGRFADVDRAQVRAVDDLDGLIGIIGRLGDDYDSTGRAEWENATLSRFLEALHAFAHALPQLYANRGEQMPDQPTWALVAELLVGATGYE
jgi:hypothetical protein